MSNKIALLLPVVFLITLFLSCDPKPTTESEKLIFLPDSLPGLDNNLWFDNISLPTAKSKMIVFLDSLGCSCRINYLVDYNLFWEYSELLGVSNFVPIVIVATRQNNFNEIITDLKFSRYNGTVFIDSLNVFQSCNESYVNKGQWSVYLTDAHCKVILFDNPLRDSKVWIQYRKVIESLLNNESIKD